VNELTVFKVGTPCYVGEKYDVKGYISAVAIKASGIEYEVTFWSGTDRKQIYMREDEFDVRVRDNTMQIGFKA
jgi:hypothetical protein